MAQSSKVPKRSNATNGRKARNDNRRLLVGRIRMGSWANKVLQAGNIYIYETELVHINNRHGKELSSIGMTALDFILFIMNHYNEVYSGTANTYRLVVKRENISNWAAIELTFGEKSYNVKTAALIQTAKLSNKKILCSKPI